MHPVVLLNLALERRMFINGVKEGGTVTPPP